MKITEKGFKTIIKVILLILLFSLGLSGCDVTEVDTTNNISENIIDYNNDSRLEKLAINMVEGKYHEENEIESELGWNWEGKFVLQLTDNKGVVLSKLDLNKALNFETLNFNGRFTIEFDDYNKDGDIDFAIGQYYMENTFEYTLFTIKSSGQIELLPIEEGKILSYYEGYSTKFEKTEKIGFKARYYNNSMGENIEVNYRWTNNRFAVDKNEEMLEDAFLVVDTPLKNDKDTEDEILASIKILNLNTLDKGELVLPLFKGWTAKKILWNKPKDFEFINKKNKELEEIWEYKIYNEEGKEIGWFGLIMKEEYSNEFNFPDNFQFEDLKYKGPTKLGKGNVYLRWLDNPKQDIKDDLDYYHEYFARVPIVDENLEYNLRIEIENNDELEEILVYMKSILVTDEDVEQKVYDLFQNDKLNKKDIKELFRLLPYVDWGVLAGISDETFFTLIEWLKQFDYINIEDMITVISSTNGLDGAYSESFAYMMKDLLIKDEPQLIKALTYVETEERELACFYLAYALGGEEDADFIEYLKRGIQSDKYIKEEKKVVEFILEALFIN